MAYGANQHNKFSERIKNWTRAIQNLDEEGMVLDQIYVNESVSGTDPAFSDTGNGTAAEHIDIVVLIRRVNDILRESSGSTTHEDQTPRITPFLQ
jgi:hypothetical protein